MPTFAAPPPEFVRLSGIVNQTTGELVPVDIEIHRDDVDWLVALWQPTLALDWEIHRATVSRALLAQGADVTTRLMGMLGIPGQN